MSVTHTSACSNMRLGIGASGNRFSLTVPRMGRDRPFTNKTTTITISGIASLTPFCSHSRLDALNQSALLSSSMFRTAPRARPPAMASGIDRRLPIRAAASAGTISAVRPIGVIVPWIGPTMITARVALTEAMTQLTAASVCGEYPSRIAPFSLPAAARVARPKRV